MLFRSKVVILSHSTVNNLTRDWDNTASIWSASTTCPGRGKNEALACHQLHYNWDFCQQAKTPDGQGTGVAQCQYDIPAEAVYDAISEALQKLEEAQAA